MNKFQKLSRLLKRETYGGCFTEQIFVQLVSQRIKPRSNHPTLLNTIRLCCANILFQSNFAQHHSTGCPDGSTFELKNIERSMMETLNSFGRHQNFDANQTLLNTVQHHSTGWSNVVKRAQRVNSTLLLALKNKEKCRINIILHH